MPPGRLLALGLVAWLVAMPGWAAADDAAPPAAAALPFNLTPPARPADIPAADWPFLPDGRLRHGGGDFDVSTPTTHISRHGKHIEISTPTETFSQHGNDVEISTPTSTISKHGDDFVISTPTGTVVRHGGRSSHAADRDDDDDADAGGHGDGGGGAVAVVAVALGAYFARRAWLRRRRRPIEAMGRPTYGPRPSRRDPARGLPDGPGAGAGAAVLEQLLRLERRLALIETAVTSSEFELQRGFSTLERGAGRS